MKQISFLVFLTVAFAIPQSLEYKNLFKTPIHDFEVDIHKGRIIGGEEATPNSIPAQAFLTLYTTKSAWYCGGSLISPNYVLTAGHCGVEVVQAEVLLGKHVLGTDEESSVSVISTEILVHPDYDDKLIINDLALVRLPGPVALSFAIQPSKLPSRADARKDYLGDLVRISGWGLTDGFDFNLSPTLQYVYVNIISREKCEEDFGDLVDSIICTSGEALSGSCNGDSGGPLVDGDTQIGIVSYGVIYCLPGYPSAFTKVASFLDWIEENSDMVVADS